MHVIADIPTLKKAVTTLKPVVPARGHAALPVLRGVHIDARGDHMVLTATDLDRTARMTVLCETATEGQAIVPLLDLDKLLKGKGRVELAVDAEEVRVVNGLTTRLRALPLDDFPKLDRRLGDYGPAFPLDLAAIASVLPATSKDQARPILTGVLFEPDGTVVGTDSYRLHVATQVGDFDPTGRAVPFRRMLVPAVALAAVVKRGGPVTMRQHPEGVLIEGDGISWEVRCIDGEFPNYKQLIPASQPAQVMLARPAFDTALKEIAAVARNSLGSPVVLHDGSPLRLTCKEQDSFDIETEVQGFSDVKVAFNPGYLLDLLTGVDACTIGLTDALKPAMVRSTDAEGRRHTRLLMPVRV
jgi:DNA polymerase III subunit beta